MSSVAFEGERVEAPRHVLRVFGPRSLLPPDCASPHTILCLQKGHPMGPQDRSILLTGAGGGSGAACDDPATVDRTLVARKGAPKEAGGNHSCL